MSELSTPPSERARKAYGRVLQAMQDPGSQRNVAQVLGVSESTVSRIKTEKLEDAIALMTVLGFKVVDQSMRCYPEDYVQALHTMARMHVTSTEPTTLQWEEGV